MHEGGLGLHCGTRKRAWLHSIRAFSCTRSTRLRPRQTATVAVVTWVIYASRCMTLRGMSWIPGKGLRLEPADQQNRHVARSIGVDVVGQKIGIDLDRGAETGIGFQSRHQHILQICNRLPSLLRGQAKAVRYAV